MQQLSGQDAMFIHTELEGLPQHIGGVSIYNQATAPGGRVRFKQILETLESRLHLAPVLTRKLVTVPWNLDRPYWVDDPDFNLEYHVRHIALPRPGDWRQLCILTARIHSQPLARNRPLWEMYVIEGLNAVEGLPPGCFALLQKVHHSAMDGATGVQINAVLHDLQPTPRIVEPPPFRRVERLSRFELYRRALRHSLRKPGEIYKLGRDLVPALRRIQQGRKEHLFEELDEKQATRFQGRISRHRVVDMRKFDFATIRAIKNTCPGATINDVMLTIVGGALVRYLESKGELPEGTLVSGCPIDVRSAEERAIGGNMVGFMTVPLRTDLRDPVARLAAVHKESLGAKAYAEALGPRIAMELTDVVPGGVLATALRLASATGLTEMSVMFNTIVTNVPGTPVQLYLCGAELVQSLSLGPLMPNMGLFHIVLSMVQGKQGSITVSFTACRDMMPDPQFYAQCLQAAFDELRDATLVSVTEPAAPARRAATRKRSGAARTRKARPAPTRA